MAKGQVTDDELEKRFGYHRDTPETIEKHQDIRGNFLDLAKMLNELLPELLPEGREKSLAFTSLQEAAMWSNASVACNLAPLDLNG